MNRILIACEESQRVTEAFRKKGVEAYSCDILETSGKHPEWHIKDNVLNHLNEEWDCIIAFPPCTHLAVSGARHFEQKRCDGRQKEAIELFCAFLKANSKYICIENPVNIISGQYVIKWFPDLADKYGLPLKPSQIIQPWQFGHPYEKKTCLWLKGLPPLKPTNIVTPEERVKFKSGRTMGKWFVDSWKLPPKERSIIRSKTFQGIADAMAEQWSSIL